MAFKETGQADLRAQQYDSDIKQLAKYAYKFKQLVSVVPSSAWKTTFFREVLTIPEGIAGNATKGIPRGADFPNAVVSWEKVNAIIQKYGLETNIDYEDIITDQIDVRDRTLIRITEGVAKAVDAEICAVLTENYSVSSTQSSSKAQGFWNQTSGAIVKDIATMKKQIKTYYDNADKFVLVVHPDREVDVMNYVYEKGSQAPTLGAQMALNGSITNLAGAEIITSSVISASYALMVVPKRCATWDEAVPLSSDTKSEKFKGDTLTVCEMGVTRLTDPKAVVQMQIVA